MEKSQADYMEEVKQIKEKQEQIYRGSILKFGKSKRSLLRKSKRFEGVMLGFRNPRSRQ
ncbi:hypothetical protein PIB30_102350, partial [Stylosanthes scabra]|nr:hypothetical protein [Stylosanthes scabra]